MEELSSILEELKEKMPLLEEVANPALQPRHWIDIHDTLGTLEEFCPVEVERRERIEAAKPTGEPADVSDLVSPHVSESAAVLCCCGLRNSHPRRCCPT